MNKLSVIITSNTEDRLDDIHNLLINTVHQIAPFIIEPIFVAEGLQLYQQLRKLDLPPQVSLYQAPDGVGLAGGRNIGIAKATGSILAFLDDDIVLPIDWARHMVMPYEDNSIIGVTSHALADWIEWQDSKWFPKELDWLISCTRWTGWTEPRRVSSAWGMNMSFRREVFEKCGLFNEDTGYHKGFVAEDIEFSHRVRKMTGNDIWFEPKAIVYHRVYPYRLTPQYIKERSIWIGQTHRMARKLYPEDKLAQADTGLIKKILKRLPTMTPKQLRFTLRALFWVAYGYYVKG